MPTTAVNLLRAALGIDESLAEDLYRESEPRVIPAGGALFRAGQPADAMYVVMSGELIATVETPTGAVAVGRIRPGEPVGEMQVLSGGARTATVSATADTAVARISREAIERLARERPYVVSNLAEAIRRRLRHNQLATILPGVFGPLDDAMLQDIESAAEWVSLPQGEVLFEQGDPGEAAYILVNGRLQVAVRSADTERVVGESVPARASARWPSSREQRSASVVALRDSDLVMLDRSEFDHLIAKYPQILRALTKLVVNRLRRTQSGNAPDNGVRIIGVVPAGRDVPLADFAQQLASALAPYGASRCLRSEDVDGLLGTPGIARTPADDPGAARIAGLIAAEEARARFVLLVADADGSPWSRRCVRHADRICSWPKPATIRHPELSNETCSPELGDGPTSRRASCSCTRRRPSSRRVPATGSSRAGWQATIMSASGSRQTSSASLASSPVERSALP